MSVVNCLRALRFAPPWAVGAMCAFITCALAVALLGTLGLDVGIGTVVLGLAFGLGAGVAIAFSTVHRRRRYRDTATMRTFFAAIDTGRLPEHLDQEQWGSMIGSEITERTRAQSSSWAFLILAAGLVVNAAVNEPRWFYVATAVFLLGQFAWIRVSTPRILASLTSLAAQGQERGYPAITQFR
ncbi:hypothetical protein [Rhodococcus sp. PvR099]|uniref:hypothetical protein n=1 Tax=Rhodococcus sp. PvR099 TaxID=2806602 RepID=UPI001AE71257|nr:hypothetical protein [Rhodococcus sp. PvR099]MBP1158111.1 hypothetical protein [Rhodococcus sp. PvR099]